ncbi:MAG: AEC family transporter [Propionicimonas sp.]|uniref:AEC family transporter n=1 Tax=Propionicimonas sp. TaxID=1955623 RepID=UPI002B20FB44|nr:AEC family transporter [Propionicimonas sp.]MEA4943034.1 AEC family transporter [Propionicimonas sp.]MEA5052493.1 AEC family transporter [Propionicimonas sp.]MEA5116642.1 AEC family transporter [Propionicimonas sp.]
MLAILTGFAVIALAVAVGYAIARSGLLGDEARPVLAKLTFNILMPFLLFSVLATAQVGALFSSLLPVSAIAAVTTMTGYALVSRLAWHRDLGRTVIGSLGAGYVNANNIGVPIALYMLGDAAYSAPIVLLQLLVFAPIALTTLDGRAGGKFSPSALLRSILTNPIIVASGAGLLVSVTGVTLPPIVLDPITSIGHAAVPVILISFGMSMHGQRVLQPGSGRRDAVLATVLKLLVMPVVAYLVGRFWFGLDAHALYAVTVLAALPSAQNVFNYAQRYGVAETLARDTVFLTTVYSVPVLLGVALLLG